MNYDDLTAEQLIKKSSHKYKKCHGRPGAKRMKQKMIWPGGVGASQTAVTHDTDTEKEQITYQEEAFEPLWKVIAHDDPVTTMEFVVRIMVQIFKKPLIFAEAIMWQVHNEGLSVVDTLPKAEAERRVKMATMVARLEGFPFRFTLEPAD